MLNELNIKNVLDIYENEISKNVKNKKKLYYFDINKIQNINSIINMLKVSNVGHEKYNIFVIHEPKERLIMSLSVKDKVINHFVTKYILEKKLSKYLDDRNVATRKNKGTDYGIRLVKKYLNIMKNKYDDFYALKIDISKYFYSIDHNVLKKLLIDKLNNYEYEVICKIINTTNKKYINETIAKIRRKYNYDIPDYFNNKGLPIGNMTSQFLSIFYLNELDHFIVHNLKLKYYVRYMDDFIIINNDKKRLKEALKIIEYKLNKEYKLNLNKKKTSIINVKHGFSFLGYVFKIKDKKVIIKVRNESIKKIKKRVKAVKYLLKTKKIDYYNAFCTIMTYSNSYKYCKNNKINKIINRYFYEK